jgi:hypothetical protein
MSIGERRLADRQAIYQMFYEPASHFPLAARVEAGR